MCGKACNLAKYAYSLNFPSKRNLHFCYSCPKTEECYFFFSYVKENDSLFVTSRKSVKIKSCANLFISKIISSLSSFSLKPYLPSQFFRRPVIHFQMPTEPSLFPHHPSRSSPRISLLFLSLSLPLPAACTRAPLGR